MSGIEIFSTGSYLPEKVITNEMFSRIVETDDEWISTRTGIKERHFAENEDTSELAVKAAKQAMIDANIERGQISLVIVATFTPNYMSPSISCVVHKELKLSENVLCFDMNGACSGFIYALNTAKHLLASMPDKLALVIGSDTISKVVDYSDRGTCVLFGDGAGAAIVGLNDSEYRFCAGTEGSTDIIFCNGVSNVGNPFCKGENIQPLHHINMNGREVFRFAVESIQKCVKNLLSQANLKTDDIDYFVCHQANKRILTSAASKLGVPDEKFYTNLDHVGNTSAASIPIALDEMKKQGLLKKDMRVVCAGFGGGLVYGGVLFTV